MIGCDCHLDGLADLSDGAWDFFGKTIDAAKQSYGWTLQAKQGQPLTQTVAQQQQMPAQPGTDWTTILTYGAVAAVGIGAAVYFLRKRRK